MAFICPFDRNYQIHLILFKSWLGSILEDSPTWISICKKCLAQYDGIEPRGGHSESNWRHVRPQNSTSKKDPYKVPRMFSKSDPYKVKLLIYNTLMLHTFESNYDVHTLKYANKIWSRANIHLE